MILLTVGQTPGFDDIDKIVLAIPFSLNLSIAMKLNNTFVMFLLKYARMFSRHRFNVGKM